mmetsp:Transcript_20203/g.33811  ORF Transcript_20203/g.33811 Transcript_20203/m.33811 type:complete len:580 (-) Transcript_20203:52-1791(-)
MIRSEGRLDEKAIESATTVDGDDEVEREADGDDDGDDDDDTSHATSSNEAAAVIAADSGDALTSSAAVRRRRVINKTTGEISASKTTATAAVAGTALSATTSSVSAAAVASAADAPAEGGDTPMLLDKSLSSAFFHNLRKSGDKSAATGDAKYRGDDLLPPAPAASASDIPVEVLTREQRQRDAAAAVAQMRERLRVMGMLKQTRSETPPPSDSPSVSSSFSSAAAGGTAARSGGAAEALGNTYEEEDGDFEAPSPPPPPQRPGNTTAGDPSGSAATTLLSPKQQQQQQQGEKDISGYETASTTSGHEEEEEDELHELTDKFAVSQLANSRSGTNGSMSGPGIGSSHTAEDIAIQLKKKSLKYKTILSELETAKLKAAESYQELMELRQSLDNHNSKRAQSTTSSSSSDMVKGNPTVTSSALASPALNASMAEVDHLMHLFRDSFTSLVAHSHIDGMDPTATVGSENNKASATAYSTGISSITQQTQKSLGFSVSKPAGHGNGVGITGNSGGGSETLVVAAGQKSSSGDADSTAAAAAAAGEEAEISTFLEKYSDKLVDLVGAKLLAKMSDSTSKESNM